MRRKAWLIADEEFGDVDRIPGGILTLATEKRGTKMAMESNEALPSQEQEVQTPEQIVSEFDRLVPILFVADLEAERDFYVQLGFTVSYQGPEFPEFIALACGPIEFGIERKPEFAPELPDRVLAWQLGVTDIETTKHRLTAAEISFSEEWVTPREDWKYRLLHTRTPNGYQLLLEGAKE
jgi:catechol 2,3-dioxygenase-like lactoylglutathione lyase family enzyme